MGYDFTNETWNSDMKAVKQEYEKEIVIASHLLQLLEESYPYLKKMYHINSEEELLKYFWFFLHINELPITSL